MTYMRREKRIELHRSTVSASILLVLTAVLVAAPALWALTFGQTKIIIEVNATDGDAGIQISVDAEGWDTLEIFDPNGQQVLHVQAAGSIGQQGVTEFFFESAEPSFDDLTLAELFARFPEGNYTFVGRTVDGKPLNGKARLSHNIPAGPNIAFPPEDATLPSQMPVVIRWDPVTGPFPGANSAVTIVGYQVIVDLQKSKPLRVFSVNLPAAATQVTISPEFIQGNSEYKFEVLAIEASGNQTITEGGFKTR